MRKYLTDTFIKKPRKCGVDNLYYFFLQTFFAGAFFATGFATTFFAGAFFATGFAAAFFAGAFFAAGFAGVTFLAAVFFVNKNAILSLLQYKSFGQNKSVLFLITFYRNYKT